MVCFAVNTTGKYSNRFAVLASTDDDGNLDERPYQLVRRQRSVRSAAKRQPQHSAAQDTGRQSSQPADQPRTRAVTGQSSVVNLALRAAKRQSENLFSVLTMLIWPAVRTLYELMSPVSALKSFLVSRQILGVVLMNLSDRRPFRLCENASNRDRLY